MAKCFCFKSKRRRRNVARSMTRHDLSVDLPPPAIGRVSNVNASDDSVYRLISEGKMIDIKRILKSSKAEEREKRLNWTDNAGRSPLILAVKEGHLECIHTLLSFDPDVNQVSFSREEGTALHIAVKKKLPLKVVYALLSKGANPFVENCFHCTAWDFAQMYTNWTATSIFRNLGLFRRNLPIQIGSNPHATSTRDVCILPRYEYRSSSSLRRIGRTMHISSIGPGEEQSDFDLTGVQAEWISEEVSDDIASILLTFPSSRARLAKDLSNENQRTDPVLHVWIPKWAVWSIRELLDIVELADELPSSLRNNDNSEHDVNERIAHWIGRQTISQASGLSDDFITGSVLPDEVYKKVSVGDSRELKYLLSSMSKVEKARALCWEDIQERTPLMIAAQKGYQKCVKLLLESKANVHQSSRGEHAGTALHIAIVGKAPSSIVECLLSHNANPFVENHVRVTASDLSGGDKKLMIREGLLFNENMTGNITLKGQSSSLGSNKDFQVLVAPRYACCDRPQDLCRISKTLHVYESDKNFPLFEIDLCEASAELQAERTTDYTDILITFPETCILKWNWKESEKPSKKSRVQIWVSYGSIFKKFSDLIQIINIDDGMSIGRSVRNVWKASGYNRDSISSEQSARVSIADSTSSTTPILNND